MPGPGFYNLRRVKFDKHAQGNADIGEHMGAREIDSRSQRISRQVRAKIYSGSLDIKKYNPNLKELTKEQKLATEEAAREEKMR